MINEKDILARLQAGEDAQEIADELVAALNNATNTYMAEQAEAKRKAEAEKAKAEAIEEEKDELAQIIADAVMDYIAVAAPELVEGEDEDLSGDEVRKLLDSMIPLMVSMKNLAGIVPNANPFSGAEALFSSKSPVSKKPTDDEIIKNFLNKNIH